MQPVVLWAMLWGDGAHFHEIRIGHSTSWVPCANRRAFERLVRADDVEISCVPRTAMDRYAVGKTSVLWVRCETKDAAERLSHLPVAPSLVIREGATARRTALWALSEPLYGDWVTRATERLSYACKGRRKAADVSAMFPSPWTRITLGRSRPVKCHVEYESETFATAREIVGRLPDAPAPDAWRNAA